MRSVIGIWLFLVIFLAFGSVFAAVEHQEDMAPVNKNMQEPEIQVVLPTNDVDVNAQPQTHQPTEAFGDLIRTIDVETLLGSNLCLGVEYAFGYLWVTNAGAASTGPPNYLAQIDISGATPVVVANHDQGTTSGWGWRDLCDDGTYLYASDSPTIQQIDPTTGQATGVVINGPENPNRALAYDPATDHFWTVNFAGNLYEIDRNGTIINTFANPVSSYGAGWDMWSSGGPYLWLNAGTAYGDTYHMDQVNPVTGALTGVSVLGTTGAIAGGLDIDVDVAPGKIAAVALGQRAPDIVDIWDLGDYGDPDDPTPPKNFVAYSDYTMPNGMLLTWTDPSEYINGNPLTNFTIEIMRDGNWIASVPMGTQTYTDAGLVDGQVYTYEIYAKDNLDSTSSKVSASWTAGGAGKPMPPTNFVVTDLGGGQYQAAWTNPSKNIDGTPMDDLAGINLYEDGTLLTTFTVASGDTGQAAAQAFTPSTGTHVYYVTAVDNETPPFESDPSNTSYSPLGLPFFDDFATAGVPNPGFWLNDDAEVTDQSVNPPSAPYALTLDGFPHAAPEVGDVVTLLPVDLSAYAGQGAILSYWYQPQGSGNAPETGDSLLVDFLNDQGVWVTVRSYPGTAVQPFVNEIIALDGVNPGTGATFFHAGFQIRFRNYATVSTSTPFDHWFIDDVFLGLPNNDPIMTVTPTMLSDTLLVGATDVLQLTVGNAQPLPSNLSFTITENPAVDWLSVNPASGSVPSSQQLAVDVNFDATMVGPGTYNTQLIVAGNDPVTPQITVDVTLVANQAPVIAINPDTFDVTLTSGQTIQDTLYISNVGNGPLVWDGAVGADLPELIYFQFDEAGATQTANNANPQTAVSQYGTLMGAMTMGGTGFAGSALVGTGGSSSSDYVDANWVTNLGTGSWTISMWLNNMDMSTTLRYHFGDNTANSFRCFSGGVAGAGNLMLRGGGLADVTVTGVGPGPNVVTFVYDAAAGEVRAYLNDVLQTTVPQSGVDITGTANFKVGGYSSSNCIGAGELMDEFKLYNRAIDVTEGSRGQWLTINPTSGTIPPAGTQEVVLTFDPSGLLGGDYDTKIIITSNDPANPEVAAGVHMKVIGIPVISSHPDPLMFDSTFVGLTPEKILWVENAGSDQLDVTSVTVTNSVFTVDTTMFSLTPFDSLGIQVKFSPLVPGPYDGWIIINSNDPNTPIDSVWVEAVAIEAPVAVIGPNFTNPVQVNLGDSLDLSINVANAGGSDLVWDAALSMNPGSMVSYPVTFGMFPASENAEVTPHVSHSGGNNAIDATWDLQFSFNLETASGALGNAGAEFDGQYFYTTRWASNLIHRYNLDGTLAEEFSISGVTGLRDLAFDGTFMYGGAASTTIYIMDFTNKLLVGTITSPVAVRHIAYDEGLDAFWVGNWDTDIVLVDRNGNQLASIPATSHGLGGMYGSAYDSYSAGGPYLWVFDQGGGAGTPQLIHQFDLSTGLATGVTHDVVTDIPGTQGIGGGLWIGEGFVAGKASIGGVLQGTPDMFFVYELAETAAPWLALFDTHGVVAPGDNQDVNLRLYGNNSRGDTMYVVFSTNDPSQAVINVPIVREVVSGVGGEGLMPTSFDVAQNYPNPFNPTTTIKYQLPQASNVKLVIYNVLGQKIRTLVNGKVEAGYHQVVWDGRNDAGTKMASGLYIYRFEAGDFQKVQKMLMLK